MKKILISLITIAAVAAVVIIGGTTAFFSDTETSTGNTFTAGALDLGIDNHSYYNGVLNDETTWRVDYDLSDDPPRQFFDFDDLKPGDWGEDTISLHVNNNDAWLCADVTLTSNDENNLNEPEAEDGDDTSSGIGAGELAQNINFFWWADDGDNVFETCRDSQVPECVDEILLPAGSLGNLGIGQTMTVALADSIKNIWNLNQAGGPFPGDEVKFLAKAWCFGDANPASYSQDGGNQQSGPDDRPFVCDGSNKNNITQTDSLTMDIAFRALQARNNGGFVCRECSQQTVYTATAIGNDQGTLKNGNPITDPNRTNPNKANGAPDWVVGTGTNFYSLGKNTSGTEGWVILKFAGLVGDGAGDDLSVHEATNGRDAYPLESAKVEVSLDGITWYSVGTATSEPGGDGVTFFDVSSTPLNVFQYVRLTDVTDYGPHDNAADGFDLDAVDAVYGNCE